MKAAGRATVVCVLSLIVCAPTLHAGDVCSLIDWWYEPDGLSHRFTESREQVEPLIDHPLRDPSVCKGPDGSHYTAGTDGAPILGEGSRYPVDRDGYELHQDIHRFQPVEARYVRLHSTEHAIRWQTYCVFDFAVSEELAD